MPDDSSHDADADGPHRDAAIYSLTTDPEYIYLIDPNPQASEHLSDRTRPWSLIEEYAERRYDLDHRGGTVDAWDPDTADDVEIKSCRLRTGSDIRGKFTFDSTQHHHLLDTDGDYVLVIYHEPPANLREPTAAKYIIHAHLRIPAAKVHRAFSTDFEPVPQRTKWRKRKSWNSIPGFTPERVATTSTTDCTPTTTPPRSR